MTDIARSEVEYRLCEGFNNDSSNCSTIKHTFLLSDNIGSFNKLIASSIKSFSFLASLSFPSSYFVFNTSNALQRKE